MAPFNWGSYLSLAQGLLNDSSEAAQRSAASRAYYAAYHAAREYLVAKGAVVPKASTHHAVWTQIKALDAQLGRTGLRLRDNRNRADYRDSVTNPSTLASVTVAESQRVVSEIRNLP